MAVLHQGAPFFFFNDTATTEIYTLSLHDALPIFVVAAIAMPKRPPSIKDKMMPTQMTIDRKSTRLNSSHANISYAVFCLKKKKQKRDRRISNYRKIPRMVGGPKILDRGCALHATF